METFWRDVKYGLRMLLKRPGFTAIAVVALSLGIGANTAIFSVVNAVLLRSLPYSDSDRLVLFQMVDQTTGRKSQFISFPNLEDWRSQSQEFSAISAFKSGGFTLTGHGEAERIEGGRVSSSFFRVMGVSPILGRDFLENEDKPGSDRVAIIGESLWRRRFEADPAVLGRKVTLNGELYTIVGVVPAGFKSPLRTVDAEVWITTAFEGGNLTERGAVVAAAVGRLKAGVSLSRAQAEMDAISKRLSDEYPDSNRDLGVSLSRLQDVLVGDVRAALWILFGAVGLVLLIACSNVANLLLAKATVRQKEVAIRSALGASPRRLVRQLLTESILLALFSAVVGLFLAWWGIDLLVSLAPQTLPKLNTITLDARVLAFTLLSALLTGFVFGLAPALRASRTNLTETLKEGGRGASSGPKGQVMRSILVVGEVALTFVLLVGAGLLITSFWRLTSVNPGFKADNVMTARISVPVAKYSDNPTRVQFFTQVLERLSKVPGVKSVAFASTPPFGGSNVFVDVQVEGRARVSGERQQEADVRGVTPGYFETLDIPLLRGRNFTDHDDRSRPAVAIVNESFVRAFFPDDQPLGRRFSTGVYVDDDDPKTWEVVGVVPDVKYVGLDREPRPEIYMPERQMAWGWGRLLVKTDGAAEQFGSAIRSEVLAVDPQQPVYDLSPLEEMVSRSVSPQRFTTVLLAVFALIGLVLALVGVYGLISYTVTEATHDIGVRLALGAQSLDILRLVVGRGIILALIGIAVGVVGAVAATRLMQSLLFEISPTDPWTFLAVSAALVAVGVVASIVPASRAVRVDPIEALRYE
jgi:putative ABC transport system permease protein